MKKVKWIIDLFKKEFKDSPMQSCTLNICYYNNDDSFNIFLTNINNSDLAIRQVALVSMLETAKLEEVPELNVSQSLLIHANLKEHELIDLKKQLHHFILKNQFKSNFIFRLLNIHSYIISNELYEIKYIKESI